MAPGGLHVHNQRLESEPLVQDASIHLDRETTRLILVAEDDPSVQHFIKVNLLLEGFKVLVAGGGPEAVATAHEFLPDAILLDIGLPDDDGLQVCRMLRDSAKTRNIPVIVLTGRHLDSDRVHGFAAGADDYITKPFDPDELVLRVRLAMDRADAMRSISPLTNLPGNVQLHHALEAVISSSRPFALLHIDLDNFKSFNDHYGFLRGDGVLRRAAECVRLALERHAPTGFVGHIGGDDFVAIVTAEQATGVASEVIAQWDEIAASMYDPPDARRGYIEVADRQGQRRRFPIMTVSIGIATNLHRPIRRPGEAVAIATETKKMAKMQPRSVFVMDRRRAEI